MKKLTAIALVVVLTSALLLAYVSPVSGIIIQDPILKQKSLVMYHYNDFELDHGWCGPCSGTSIGQYYRSEYPSLPSGATMYDRLYTYMDTAYTGFTDWPNYGPGFVEMALHYGYDNFRYDYYAPESEMGPVDAGTFWDVVAAIDNGWPVAVAAIQALAGFKDVVAISTDETHTWCCPWPCEKWHWIAIKGYSYWWDPNTGDKWDFRIKCTDSYSGADNLVLGWSNLVNEVESTYLRAYIIRDDETPDSFVEDFEWGGDMASLDDWQDLGGEVDWETAAYYGSVVEIDTGLHHSGTRSARFYRASSGGPYAHYDLPQPTSIGFEVNKSDTAYAEFRIGDGSQAMWLRINSGEVLEYYDGTWHSVRSIPDGYWYKIEFKNINWGTHHYDIYVSGIRYVAGAHMRSYSGYKDQLWFGSWGGSGEFWIDDIKDSLRPL